ncbi:Transposase [Paenibacillus lactis]
MIKQLQERKDALQGLRKLLNRNTSLRTQEGRQYIHCLVLLVSTEMQIEKLQGMKKDACQRP